MSEPIARHQLFEYDPNKPYMLIPIFGTDITPVQLTNHWHEELEIAYGYFGMARHYINGECYQSQPGRIIVTNSDFIHSIVPGEEQYAANQIVSLVIIIHPQFLDLCFPECRNFYFLNKNTEASPEIREICDKILDWSDHDNDLYGHVCVKGLLLQLLYYMAKEGTAPREGFMNVNVEKNIERMKGVVTFIENHYMDHITQAMVAEKFYFTPEYFSRYFKKCTGATFTDYLMQYRVSKAREDLLSSDMNITEIAMKNGFSDERRFILSFRKYFYITPLQYRKQMQDKA